MNKSVMSFLSVVLSIDHTYYANHPISITDRKNSHFFCELHVRPPKYAALTLLGEKDEYCLDIVTNCLNTCVEKIENLRKYGLSSEIVASFSIIDLLLGWFNKQFGQNKRPELRQLCVKILSTCYQWLGGAVKDSVVSKLLITVVICTKGTLSPDMEGMIKETIFRTITCVEIPSMIKQEILPLLIMVAPSRNERNLIEKVVRLWATEEENQYFYNESRVVLELSNTYPIEVAKIKPFTKCFKLKNLNEFHLQRERYSNGSRKPEVLCWIWALKIAAALL